MVVSPMSVSCVVVSKFDLLSSNEMGVKLGIRAEKSSYLKELDVRNFFYREMKSWNSTTWFIAI
jgi:hypothetical protein